MDAATAHFFNQFLRGFFNKEITGVSSFGSFNMVFNFSSQLMPEPLVFCPEAIQ